MKFYRLLLTGMATLCWITIQAQLRADFNPDKAGGCAPFTATFNNTSSGTTANTTFEWDFGNGNRSQLREGGAVYTAAGSYTVTLTIREGQQSSTATRTVTVYRKPVIAFDVDDNVGCWPFAATFTSTSSAGDGSIATYNWDYGDGVTERGWSGTAMHVYQFSQTAGVKLTAVNTFGCASTLYKPNLVRVIDPVKADFVADQLMFCRAPGTVQFTNNSSGPGPLTYTWEFGDGGRSTAANPSYTYTRRGTYTVRLTVRNAEGCENVMERFQYINVEDFTASFQVPAQICTGDYLTVANTSTPMPVQNHWIVNGTDHYYTVGNNPLNTWFNQTGTHTIELQADFGACQQTTRKQFTVNQTPVLNGFIADVQGLCGAPTRVNFRDTTSTATQWKWNFNLYENWNQVHATTKSASHNYTIDNNYAVSLTVTTAEGCSASTTKQVYISRPLVGIFIDPAYRDEACNTLKVKFLTRTTDPIVSYNWRFGDGGTSTQAEPEYTYTRPGIYTVTLTYVTQGGCTGTVTYSSIKVRAKPKANFSVQGTVCGNNPVIFNNLSTGYATQYIWDYGDGTGSTWGNNLHQYQQEGSFDVTLIAANGMCNDTITKPAVIKVSPPFAKIQSAATTCEGTRGVVTFTDGSRQATSWRWDFGDQTSATYTTPPATITHNYTRNGTYKVVLTVTNGSCSVKDSTTVHIFLRQNPVLTANTSSICTEGGAVNIEVNGLAAFNLPPGYFPPHYYHQVIREDNTPFPGSVYYSNWDALPWKASLGNFAPGEERLKVISFSNFHNCYDTTNVLPIRIKGPTAAFDIINNGVCFKTPVIFRDRSTRGYNVPIVRWEWSFGDGVTEVKTTGADVTHLYQHPGNYQVTLRTTDADGCSNFYYSYLHQANVAGPKAAFSTSSGNVVQLNTTVTFWNYTNTYNTNGVDYFWNFGNGITSTDYSPTYTYTVPGDYIVTLVAVNTTLACRDTIRQQITVRNFNTGFNTTTTLIGNYNACPPVLAQFINTSTNYTRLEWDFGDGHTLVDQVNPGHIYERAGTFIVTLRVYGYNGLTGTYRDTIRVGMPTATINIDDADGCMGHTVSLNAPTYSGVKNYVWDFGNGYLSASADSFSVHKYLAAGTYYPTVIVSNDGGCETAVKSSAPVVIHPNPVVSILPNDPLVCKGAGVMLTAQGADSYQWSPATGLSDATIRTPMAIPAETTQYTVTATDLNSCKGEGSVTVIVPKPFQISLAPAADVCKGNSIQLQANGAHRYEWIQTTSGLSNITIPNPVATPLATTAYTAVGFDQYGCYSDTAEVNVNVRPLPTVYAGADREVVYGSETVLAVTNSPDVVRWSWTPSEFLNCANCPAPVSKPFGHMQYVVSVYNQYNCEAKDTVSIKGLCSDGHIWLPSAFTPNGDGRNDVLLVSGYGIRIINSLQIFNRWGEPIFERRNFYPNDNSSAWDGRLKGKAQETGTYVYLMEMECADGQRFVRKGTVTLVR